MLSAADSLFSAPRNRRPRHCGVAMHVARLQLQAHPAFPEALRHCHYGEFMLVGLVLSKWLYRFFFSLSRVGALHALHRRRQAKIKTEASIINATMIQCQSEIEPIHPPFNASYDFDDNCCQSLVKPLVFLISSVPSTFSASL
jgi:hypothetical protein